MAATRTRTRRDNDNGHANRIAQTATPLPPATSEQIVPNYPEDSVNGVTCNDLSRTVKVLSDLPVDLANCPKIADVRDVTSGLQKAMAMNNLDRIQDLHKTAETIETAQRLGVSTKTQTFLASQIRRYLDCVQPK